MFVFTGGTVGSRNVNFTALLPSNIGDKMPTTKGCMVAADLEACGS